MKITAFRCPKCKDIVFSRARHDYRNCSCGEIAVDGGFDYCKLAFITEPPKPVELEIDVTKKELYDDWNFINKKDKYGLLKKGRKRKWVKEIIK